MPGIDVNQLWTPARGLPSPQTDQKAPVTNVRGGRYGEQYMLSLIPTKHVLADEGSYFIATNPTPGTALAYNIQAAYSDTVPLLYIQNNDSKANPFAKRMYLDYIKLICSVVPASGTGARFAVKTDPTLRTLSTNNTLGHHAHVAELGCGHAIGLLDQRAEQRNRHGVVGVFGVGSPGRECQSRRHPRRGRRTRPRLRSIRSRPVSRPDRRAGHLCRPQGQLLAADRPRSELGAHAVRVVPSQRDHRPVVRTRNGLVGAVVHRRTGRAPAPLQLDPRPGGHHRRPERCWCKTGRAPVYRRRGFWSIGHHRRDCPRSGSPGARCRTGNHRWCAPRVAQPERGHVGECRNLRPPC